MCYVYNKNVLCVQSMVWHSVRHPVYSVYLKKVWRWTKKCGTSHAVVCELWRSIGRTAFRQKEELCYIRSKQCFVNTVQIIYLIFHHSAHYSCYPSAHPTTPHPRQITNFSCSTFLSNVCGHLSHYTIPSRTPQSKPQYVPSPRPQHGIRIERPHLQLWKNLWYRRKYEVLIAVNV